MNSKKLIESGSEVRLFDAQKAEENLHEIIGSLTELVAAAWVGEHSGDAFDEAYEFFMEDEFRVGYPGMLDSFVADSFEQAREDKGMLRLRAKAALDGKPVWNGEG